MKTLAKISTALAAAMMSALISVTAAAAILTFEGTSDTIYTAPIMREGFIIRNPPMQEQHFHEIDSTMPGLASNGTGVLLNDRDTGIGIRSATGTAFSVASFDVAAPPGYDPAGLILVLGSRNGAPTAPGLFEPLGEFRTIDGSSLGNVDILFFTGLRSTGVGGSFELDNVVLTVIPEPAAWVMMIIGFGLVGGAMRHNRVKAPNAYA